MGASASGFFFQASLAHLKPMEKIEVMATITAIDQPDSGKKDFAVILNCGQAFKDVLSYKWIPPQPTATDGSLSKPEEGLLVLRVHGEVEYRVGETVSVEIEPL